MARTYKGYFLVGTLNGSPPAMKNVPLIATAYYEGNVVRISATTGSCGLAPAAGTAVYGVIGCNVTNANSSSGTYPVWLMDANNVFECIRLDTGAPQVAMGDLVDIAVASTYNYRLQATASTKVVRIVGVHPDDASGTAAGKRYRVVGCKSIWGLTTREPKG
jgi:hypothetical protein